VLLGIVEVGGVVETAMALGIAETAVKTHCIICLPRPEPADRLSWSSSSPDSPIRW